MKDAFHSFYKCILWNFTSNTIMPNLECPYFIGFEQNFASQIWQNWSLEFCKIQLTGLSNILVKYGYAEFRMPTFRRNYISPEGYLPDEPLIDWYEQYWCICRAATAWIPQYKRKDAHALYLWVMVCEAMSIGSTRVGRKRCPPMAWGPLLLISVYEEFGEPHLPVR